MDETSPWTLDYPPLFAWFEFTLSFFAQFFDPAMLEVGNLNYASNNTILFQRLSVIITDVVFAFGVKKYKHYSNQTMLVYTQLLFPLLFRCVLFTIEEQKAKTVRWFSSPSILTFLLLSNVGLFIVDHIHFQYNGFLTGILLLSIGSVLQVLQKVITFFILTLNFIFNRNKICKLPCGSLFFLT